MLGLLARGLDQETIAQKLVLSPKTIATHIQRILPKLGVSSRTQAVALAYGEGLVPAGAGAQASRTKVPRLLAIEQAPGEVARVEGRRPFALSPIPTSFPGNSRTPPASPAARHAGVRGCGVTQGHNSSPRLSSSSASRRSDRSRSSSFSRPSAASIRARSPTEATVGRTPEPSGSRVAARRRSS